MTTEIPYESVPFEVAVGVDGDGNAIVSLVGEVDMSTTQELRFAFDDACRRTSNGAVVVDCARLGFIDSSGLSELHRATGGTRRRSVVVVNAPAGVRRLFQITGLDQVLDVR